MTPEQLDEIEAQINEFGEESGFILPLVKALREAQEVIDHYERKNGPTFQASLREAKALWAQAEAEKERDEARAERDKYKAALDAELPAAWREDIESLNSCLERIGNERDEARKWLEGICAEFEGAVAHAEWRASGSKGMSVTFTGDFASVVQLPGAINKMRWWVKVFRAVLNGEKP